MVHYVDSLHFYVCVLHTCTLTSIVVLFCFSQTLGALLVLPRVSGGGETFGSQCRHRGNKTVFSSVLSQSFLCTTLQSYKVVSFCGGGGGYYSSLCLFALLIIHLSQITYLNSTVVVNKVYS